jgi:hypothetical protein
MFYALRFGTFLRRQFLRHRIGLERHVGNEGGIIIGAREQDTTLSVVRVRFCTGLPLFFVKTMGQCEESYLCLA